LRYRPDAGRVRERAATLARAVSDDPRDPFRTAEIAPAELAADPDRLATETGQISMFGGRRLVRLREAGDSIGAVFQRFLKSPPPGDAFVLVEAGELSARSSLRRAFEAADTAVAIPCYADTPRDLDELVREVMARHRIRIERDAARYLAERLGGDRGVSRQELEKLALYAGDDGNLTLADAMESVGDSAALEMDDAVLAAAEGDAARLERALDRLIAEGESPITVLRAAQRHLNRLHLLAAQVAAGMSPDEAVRGVRPPLFFKLADRVKGELGYWPVRRTRAALALLFEAEITAKRTGPPPEAVCRDALLRIARRVAEARRQILVQ
ncbi:MAG: DNA polymerase III subunit delta, partial [Stellaceae bacterium]